MYSVEATTEYLKGNLTVTLVERSGWPPSILWRANQMTILTIQFVMIVRGNTMNKLQLLQERALLKAQIAKLDGYSDTKSAIFDLHRGIAYIDTLIAEYPFEEVKE
jgi:hypothetical protein